MLFKFVQGFYSFSEDIRCNNRYILCNKSKQFLEEIYDTSETRHIKIKQKQVLWRAQLGGDSCIGVDNEGLEHDTGILEPYSKKRMFPLSAKAIEGRVNPKGIPYLYLATNKNTAVSEVRAKMDEKISVAQFGVVKDLKIIDLSISKPIGSHTTNSLKEENVWEDIASAFSAPITSKDNEALYAPTQVIAEFFKSKDIDGLAYYSMQSDEGHNIVLFETNNAVLLNCGLYQMKKISYKLEEIANPYMINDPYS